ncbi:hypothetical protein FF38_11047, partial [Lucilia cuprina]
NLVSNKTWSHFWLNEGWTVYIERRILGKLEGESYRNFAAYEGWQDLVETCEKMPAEYTKLRLDVTSQIDPDDTFSTVPYEKGSTFLWYLERTVGREQFDKFIKAYFNNFNRSTPDAEPSNEVDGKDAEIILLPSQWQPRWWASVFGRTDPELNDPKVWENYLLNL